MLHFHSLPIIARVPVAEDGWAITFGVPDRLAADFAFQAGQHAAVRAVLDGREERRTYSIVDPQGALSLRIGVRAQPGGRMSRYLVEEAKIGDAVDVLTPNGSFHTRLDPSTPCARVAFAAGSGITPVLSIIRTVLEREPLAACRLYYGNTDTARTMFLEEILGLKDRYLTRFAVSFVMSREPQEVALFNGRIDAARVREFATHEFDARATDEFFVCGPGDMAAQVQGALAELGATGPAHVEHFAAAGTGAVQHAPAPQRAAAPAAGDAAVTVVVDGRRRSFTMPRNGEAILDAAGRAGFDLPFSCRAGVCSTCRARLVSGTAEMAHNVALEEWEVEAGYILCCQARPTSATLEISYDE